MKKLFVVTAALLGFATASQAGVHFSIGIGIPLAPPPLIVAPTPVYAPAPVYAPSPMYYPPRPVYGPPPRVYYCPPPAVIYQAPPPAVVAPPAPVVYARPGVYVGIGNGWRAHSRWGHYRGGYCR